MPQILLIYMPPALKTGLEIHSLFLKIECIYGVSTFLQDRNHDFLSAPSGFQAVATAIFRDL